MNVFLFILVSLGFEVSESLDRGFVLSFWTIFVYFKWLELKLTF